MYNNKDYNYKPTNKIKWIHKKVLSPKEGREKTKGEHRRDDIQIQNKLADDRLKPSHISITALSVNDLNNRLKEIYFRIERKSSSMLSPTPGLQTSISLWPIRNQAT